MIGLIVAAAFFRRLKVDSVTAETRLSRYAGEEGRALLPIRVGADQPGKVVVETDAGRWPSYTEVHLEREDR